LIAPAYQQAEQSDTSLIENGRKVFSHPYETKPSAELAGPSNDRPESPEEFFNASGVVSPLTAVRREPIRHVWRPSQASSKAQGLAAPAYPS